MSELEYYKILQVSQKASMNEIKASYRRLAKKYHPDVNPNDPKAESQFKKINEAYGVLGNLAKRAEYDYMAQCKTVEKRQRERTVAESRNHNTEIKKAKRKDVRPIPLRTMLWHKLFLLVLFCGYAAILYQNRDVNQPYNFFKAIGNTSIAMNRMISVSKEKVMKYYQDGQWLKPIWKYALWSGNVELAKKLLERKPSCQFFDKNSYNLLMQTSDAEIAEALINVGCDVNYQAPDGETAFSLAIKDDNEKLVELLRKKGAKFPWKKIAH